MRMPLKNLRVYLLVLPFVLINLARVTVKLSLPDDKIIDEQGSTTTRRSSLRQFLEDKHIFKYEDHSGKIHVYPVNLHLKIERAPGPYPHHNQYLREYRKEKDPDQFTCASWIPKHQRKVYVSFMDQWHAGTSWTQYQAGRGHLRGEMYWLSSLDYVLQHMGFELVNSLDLVAIQAIQAIQDGTSQAYIMNNRYTPSSLALDTLESVAHDPVVRCKVSALSWWMMPFMDDKGRNSSFYFGNDTLHAVNADPTSYKLDKRHLLYPYKEQPTALNQKEGTSLPFFVHGEVALPTPTEAEAPREKRGFFLLWRNEANLDKFNCYEETFMKPLLDAGFELHSVCPLQPEDDPSIPPQYKHQFVHHGPMTPKEYSLLFRSMAFLMGTKMPTDSPTPLEGLYNGAAFLNPVFNITRDGDFYNSTTDDYFLAARTAMHEPLLKTLGPPYVYNYHVNLQNGAETGQNVLEAAEAAVQNRFASYIPPEHRLENVMKTVCRDLIESNYNCATEAEKLPKVTPPIGFLTGVWHKVIGAGVGMFFYLLRALIDKGYFV